MEFKLCGVYQLKPEFINDDGWIPKMILIELKPKTKPDGNLFFCYGGNYTSRGLEHFSASHLWWGRYELVRIASRLEVRLTE